LTIVGMSFENALIMSISALCNNGPLFSVIIQPMDFYLELTIFSKYIIICAMIFGRIEILLLFALFNPELWGK
jgi:trk system potassium uptake protein TrkH